MIRVVLTDDHVLLRQGTASLLKNDAEITVVAEAGTGREALALVQDLSPDVLILDLRLPDISGVEVARTLRQDFQDVKILILSAYHDLAYVRALLAVGVHGYLLKTASQEELVAAVHTISNGQTVLSREISKQLTLTPTKSDAFAESLSEREQQVLGMVSQGYSNKDIATTLQLGVRTVETHVRNIMEKLGARSRIEAVALARQQGLISG